MERFLKKRNERDYREEEEEEEKEAEDWDINIT